MKIPPDYKITPNILSLLAKIEANRFYLNDINPPKELLENLQRSSLLKSSLYSAKIEGNPLLLSELKTRSKQVKQLEVANLIKAYTYLSGKVNSENKITPKQILKLHQIVGQNIFSSIGNIRKNPEALYNQTGVVVELFPPASEVSDLLSRLIGYLNSEKEGFPLVKALVGHLVFEKIHPFVDGNGRVGRLLIFLVLESFDYSFPLWIPFEEYINNSRDKYYYWLDVGMQDTQGYLDFMLEAFYAQTEQIKKQLSVTKLSDPLVVLPPRQREIYEIIIDHPYANFDMIQRWFLVVPSRTLHYDLKKLVDAGLVIKVGKTRKTLYLVNKK